MTYLRSGSFFASDIISSGDDAVNGSFVSA